MQCSQEQAKQVSGQADGLCVQYGCGLSAPSGWINFDASPTLRLQRLPLVGAVATAARARFPPSVKFGDVVRGLKIPTDSCSAVYASHVLEHLALEDFNKALVETFRILKPGGVFRLVVPDLRQLAERYLDRLASGESDANTQFFREACMGVERRARGLRGVVVSAFGNTAHLWMWDELSLTAALTKVGFSRVRRASFNDSTVEAFRDVEVESRFFDAVAIEAVR